MIHVNRKVDLLIDLLDHPFIDYCLCHTVYIIPLSSLSQQRQEIRRVFVHIVIVS